MIPKLEPPAVLENKEGEEKEDTKEPSPELPDYEIVEHKVYYSGIFFEFGEDTFLVFHKA